jgi:RND family efflux transporter MFP subunit
MDRRKFVSGLSFAGFISMAVRCAMSRSVWAVVGAVLVLPACGPAPEPPQPVAVKVKKLTAETVREATRYSATVEPRQRVSLAFKVSGTVERLQRITTLPDGTAVHDLKSVPSAVETTQRDVQIGDTIPNDSVIAWLQTRDFDLQVAEAEAKLQRATEEVKRAASALEIAERDYQNRKELFERKVATRKEFEDAESARDSAAAARQSAIQEQLAARALLEQARNRRKDCELRARIAGAPDVTIETKMVEPGEPVVALQPVFTIMDLSEVHVAFGVPDTLLSRIVELKSGHRPLKVTAEALELSEAFEGRITKVAANADPATRTFLTEVTLKNPPGYPLKPGMIVSVVVEEAKEAVLLPMTAIQRASDSQTLVVYKVMEGRQVRAEPVRLGGVYNNQVEVFPEPGRLELGDAVVVTGAFRLRDGQEIQVLEDMPKGNPR